MINSILDKIDNTIECYEHSITEDNGKFVEGIIYGMTIAKASIEGEVKNDRRAEG